MRAYTQPFVHRYVASRSPSPPSGKRPRKHNPHQAGQASSRDRPQPDDPRRRQDHREPAAGTSVWDEHADARRPPLSIPSRPTKTWDNEWYPPEGAELAKDPEAYLSSPDSTQPRPREPASCPHPSNLVQPPPPASP
ncbi:hypothetical protein BD309DRAFT_891639 [Dichomitus squalens]|uniref:Uncharacterized protein n=1 Tax=Dichomitus squalens TaxID=114155 RepID=A0A4V2K4K9_9APHY|nr:hypothetical protein BD311DRAFT_827046 [Dichomitus squalens]TBU44853.1 hypothetical protein BD309DRAFT_891639 [Dichomitus squalens]